MMAAQQSKNPLCRSPPFSPVVGTEMLLPLRLKFKLKSVLPSSFLNMDFLADLSSRHNMIITALAYVLGLLTMMPIFFSSIYLREPHKREMKFHYTKKLTRKDEVVIDMLNTSESGYAWTVTDPQLLDNPIVFASDGFVDMTKYSREEIIGRNCRFLQGPATNKEDIQLVREAIQKNEELSICLINHKKDGQKFFNQLFLCPLYGYENKNEPIYFLGVQAEVSEYKPGQNEENIGWVYTNAAQMTRTPSKANLL